MIWPVGWPTGCAGVLFCVLACSAPSTSTPAAAGQLRVEPRSSQARTAADDASIIRYRTLTKDDFLADELPAHANPYAKKIGAMTCARISTTKDTGLVTSETTDEQGRPLLEVRFRALGFEAQMDRECSWWNPNDQLPHDYVLQHEQIHFAITELGARALDAKAPKIVAEYRAAAASQDEARALVRTKLETMIGEAMSKLTERHQDFDRQTSRVYAPQVQQEWFDTINEQLADTAEDR